MKFLPIILRYLISGSIAATINLVFLYVFSDVFGVWYLSASIIAFSAALIVSFVLQKFFTFQNFKNDFIEKQFFLFLAITIVNIFLNGLFMYIFTDVLKIYYILSQIISSGIIAIESFFIYNFFVFTNNKFYENET